MMRTLLVDNYDSFTYNLYQQLAALAAAAGGGEPIVVRNDELSLDEIRALPITSVVISPGPGRPDRTADFGVCARLLRGLELPILGVCLGHQGLGQVFGGRLIHAPEVMHGRRSRIEHLGVDVLRGLPQGFEAVRYHSLAISGELPDELEAIAWTDDGVLMALRHRSRPLWGIQFHPESILSEHGDRILANFLELAGTAGRGGLSWPRKARIESDRSGRSDRSDGSDRSQRSGGKVRPALVVDTRTLDLDLDPEAVFLALCGEGPNAFWLDSSLAGSGARFSYLGAAGGPLHHLLRYRVSDRRLVVLQGGRTSAGHADLFEHLQRRLRADADGVADLPFDFAGGYVGYFGYELKAECGARLVHPSPLPDACLLFADRLLVFDHQEKTCTLVALSRRGERAAGRRWLAETESQLRTVAPAPPPAPGAPRSGPLKLRLSRPHGVYLADVAACLDEIREGESYEICLTNQLHSDALERPLEVYRHLRAINPAPYSSYLRFGDLALLSSSPEQFLRVDRDRRVTSKPIKGTLGRRPGDDRQARQRLAGSVKDRAENLMIVDLLRNDLGKVCEVGTVSVPKLMAVESYATVHQLVSTVAGRLRSGLDAVDALRAAFPGGSMTGAPKLRAMEILDRLEGEARGPYAGAIGTLGVGGTADLAIVIRTAVATPLATSIGVGGAVTALSDPEGEYREAMLKADALIRALAAAGGHREVEILGAAEERPRPVERRPRTVSR